MITRLQQALRELREVELTPEQHKTLAEEEAALNARRLKVILPPMILLNLGHVALLYPGSPFYWPVDDTVKPWVQGLLQVHVITAIAAFLPLSLAVFPKRPVAWAGPLAALTYQLHAAAVAGVDQLNQGTVAPYVGYALVNVVVVAMSPRQAVVVFATATAGFIAAINFYQPDELARIAVRPTGPSVMVPAICIAWFLYASRRRSFYFRVTIAKQRAELAELNEHLQDRVAEHVAALVARADEVERLNEQLRAKVKDRSKELAAALKRLARHEDFSASVEAEGSLLAGRFEVGKEIGSGGMGVVHEGTDRRSGAQVAIKMMRGIASSPASVARFLREVETAASVTHPAIVRMVHVDVTGDGTLFQIQERVEGYTLAHWLSRVERLDVPVALRCIEVLSDALAAAHDQGVVHRDVKPANVMLTAKAPGLKLLDFGIAKAVLADQAAMTMTATGAMVGTPAYMGPELWDGTVEATAAADVYAIGVSAVRMLTGSIPTLGSGAGALDEVELPDSLRSLLWLALATDPEDRPSASVLRDACRALADEEGFAELAPTVAGGLLGAERTPDPGTATHLSFG